MMAVLSRPALLTARSRNEIVTIQTGSISADVRWRAPILDSATTWSEIRLEWKLEMELFFTENFSLRKRAKKCSIIEPISNSESVLVVRNSTGRETSLEIVGGYLGMGQSGFANWLPASPSDEDHRLD